MPSEYAKDIRALKDGVSDLHSEVAVIKALSGERLEVTKLFRLDVSAKLDRILANGAQNVSREDLRKSFEVHTTSCPSRNPGEDEDEETGPWGLAKYGLKEFGLFGFMGIVILSLMVLLLAQAGFFQGIIG